MGHAEYVSQLDEEQLECLIERANGRLKQIRESGWVRLWIVHINGANVAWFPIERYGWAVSRLTIEVERRTQRGEPSEVEAGISRERYRPAEAAELAARTSSGE